MCNINLNPVVKASGPAATFASALSASDSMAQLLKCVREGNQEHAVNYTERIVHALAKVLQDYGLDIAEVLPVVTCARCARPCIEYRSFNGEGRVCVLCITEHVLGASKVDEAMRALCGEIAKMRDLDKRLRIATGLLTELAGPSARVTAFLDAEAKR